MSPCLQVSGIRVTETVFVDEAIEPKFLVVYQV